MIDKLDGQSMDLVKDNVEKLKELFPSIVKEDKIDFEELELLLGENINRNKEQYSFTWNGKTEATKLAQKRSTGTLRPCKEESKDWDTTQNLYIEGDNLEVLRLLQASYNGRIKMIYIDPPYNTGHDFVYKDNFEDNIKNYKEQTGQAQKSNADTDGRYHTNWLNMMYPRLKLARNLLTDNGIIYISIDENEVGNLRKICDEVFGENNLITEIIWKKKAGGSNDSVDIAVEHEYIAPHIILTAREVKKVANNNLKRFNIGVEQLKILHILSFVKELNINEIAKILCKDIGTISRCVESLCNKKYIIKFKQTNDRRIHIVSLTPEGRVFFEKIDQSFKAIMQSLEAIFSKEEKEQLHKTLDKIIAYHK